MNIDIHKLIANIKFLAKEKSITLGDIEKQAGVSSGYLSRIIRGEINTSPSIDFIMSVANQLDVSMNALLFSEIYEIQHNSKIYSFIDKLLIDSYTEKIKWNVLSKTEIATNREKYTDLPVFNPLLPLDNIEESINTFSTDIFYRSLFEIDDRCRLSGDIVYSQVSKDIVVYLFCFDSENAHSEVIEIYINTPTSFDKIIRAEVDDTIPIFVNVRDLYNEANDLAKRVYLSKTTESIIDNYLKNERG